MRRLVAVVLLATLGSAACTAHVQPPSSASSPSMATATVPPHLAAAGVTMADMPLGSTILDYDVVAVMTPEESEAYWLRRGAITRASVTDPDRQAKLDAHKPSKLHLLWKVPALGLLYTAAAVVTVGAVALVAYGQAEQNTYRSKCTTSGSGNNRTTKCRGGWGVWGPR